MAGVLISDRRGDDTDTERGVGHMTTEAEIGLRPAGKPRTIRSHEKLEEARRDFFLEPLEGLHLCRYSDFRLLSSRTGGE